MAGNFVQVSEARCAFLRLQVVLVSCELCVCNGVC
jgi:hypothetical protein